MISFDTENDPQGNLTLSVFFNGKDFDIFDYKDFKNQLHMKKEIQKYIIKSDEKLFLAHNLEYDLVNLTKPVFIGNFKWYYSGRLIFCDFIYDEKKKFLDTFNFSFSSLKTLGKNIGLEKFETDDFYNIDYCKRDAEIVYFYYKKFKKNILEKHQLNLKMTLAGTSQNILLKKYVDIKIDNINIDERLLNSYYGGRCEVFNLKRYKRYIAELDVNSMYPYVMQKNLFPVTNFFISKKPVTDYYIAHIKVDIKEDTEFPIICKRTDKLFFPVGRFETWSTSIEIKKAIEEGQINEIKYLEVYNFSDCQQVFKDFITDIYNDRKKAKEEKRDFDSLVNKYLLNSSYGRFALHKEMRILEKITPENENEIDPINDDLGWMTVENNSGKNKNFAIASFVTAYSRIELFNLIQEVKKNGYIPLYCDTDSCYFTTDKVVDLNTFHKKVLKQFTVNNDLGGLSFAIYTTGQFYNAKMYELYNFNTDHKLKIKGIPEKFRKEYLEKRKVTVKKPLKLRSGLRGIQGKEMNVWYEQIIEQRTEYKKREVLEDGKTSPVKFN